jgi:hypothetical protein
LLAFGFDGPDRLVMGSGVGDAAVELAHGLGEGIARKEALP